MAAPGPAAAGLAQAAAVRAQPTAGSGPRVHRRSVARCFWRKAHAAGLSHGFCVPPPFCALIEQKICRTPGGAEGVSGIVGGAGVAGWAQGNHVSAMLWHGFVAVFQGLG